MIENVMSNEAYSGWETLQISHQIHYFLMAPINDSEILMLRDQSNSVVLNIDKMSISKLSMPYQTHGLSFQSNQFIL